VPVNVTGISNAVGIAAGIGALLRGPFHRRRQVVGEATLTVIGNGTNTDSNVPVPVSGIWNAVRIAAGLLDSVRSSDGSVKCWGLNTYGELGNGTNTHSNVPVA